MAALTRLYLTTKQIASMLGISVDSVHKSRQRLRQRFQVGVDTNLDELVAALWRGVSLKPWKILSFVSCQVLVRFMVSILSIPRPVFVSLKVWYPLFHWTNFPCKIFSSVHTKEKKCFGVVDRCDGDDFDSSSDFYFRQKNKKNGKPPLRTTAKLIYRQPTLHNETVSTNNDAWS